MSAGMQNTGVAMMLKAIGFDPAVIVAKGQELEAMGKVLASDLKVMVGSMETRMAHIEQMLIRIEISMGLHATAISRLESAAAGTTPAGDTAEQSQVLNGAAAGEAAH